jgi:hypothetical protein
VVNAMAVINKEMEIIFFMVIYFVVS